MPKNYHLGLASKIRFTIFATTFITIGILCAIILLQVKHKEIESAMNSMLLSAKYNASNTHGMLNSSLYPFKAYASSLSSSHDLDYTLLTKQIIALTHESANIDYGFLYLADKDYSDAPKQIRLDNRLMIFANNNQSMQANSEILTLPAVQQAISTKTEQLGIPTKLKLEGKEIKASIFAFPILNAQREVVGVLGGILNVDYIAEFLLATKNNSYPNEARILIAQDGTIITSNSNNKDKIIGLNLRDLIKMAPHLENVINEVMNNKEIKAPITDTTGQQTYAAHANVNISLFNNIQWHILTLVPKNDVLSIYYDLRLQTIFIALSVIGIVLVVLTLFTKWQITDRLVHLNVLLNEFFQYLNHENKIAPKPLMIKTHDELGTMTLAINQNIERTQKSLEKDSQAVLQSVQTAKEIESGNFTARITENPANPQLNELKDVLNNMLEDLQHKIGSDTNEIARVFDSYTKLDFTTEVKDAKGRVEIVTNALGNEI
ncbi:HAMP domain-containing protein, partial [Helicobacter sp. MIT 14-3879]|uniref:cache domain-containing protein n=1 Tax=Helicobacter sp. MIT 14-3879 TaxID=2040649 RepID=UPI000E1E40CE